ncbi:DUF1800 domain-containing protein [Roseateles aquatilis]|nr:DUF1800 domain-containing protein [Roseateles aquatilis]
MFRFPWSSAAVTAAAAALSACGGGGGDSSAPASAAGSPSPAPGPSPTPAPPPGSTPAPAPGPSTDTGGASAPAPAAGAVPLPLPSDAQAARFLAQAGFAASEADIASVKSIGYGAWLDLQFLAPRTESHWDWVVRNGFAAEDYKYYYYNGFYNTVWRKFIGSPDQLRQRMVLALSEIFVVSALGFDIPWRTMCLTAYADVLEDNAFGTFRGLLEAVALSPAMGSYLAMRGSRKEDAATGRQPDENFAREVMQLFTIGLVQLNLDGTAQTRGGRPVETYNQATVTQMARAFTGWEFDTTSPGGADCSFMRRPMKHNAANFSGGAKTVLGTTIPAGADGPTALRQALDVLANHPNVGPFFGRQLIQRFVCSNPSPAYVQRVAQAFNDNGQGVRGDLKAVLRAVLLDVEARLPGGGANSGKLREPVLRFVQVARNIQLTSAGQWGIYETTDMEKRLGQSPFFSPSVFNFYRPGYVPPNSGMAAAGVTAPEFQLLNEVTVTGYLNFMQTVLTSGQGDATPNYAADLALVADPRAMVARQALLLAGDGISDATQQRIVAAVSSIAATTDAGRLNRVRAGWMLLLACPEYQVQK